MAREKINGHATIIDGPSKDRLKQHFFSKKMERPHIYFTIKSNIGNDTGEFKAVVDIHSLKALDELRDGFAYEGYTESFGKHIVNGRYYFENKTGSMSFSYVKS